MPDINCGILLEQSYTVHIVLLIIGGGAYETRRLVPPQNLGPKDTLWSVPPQNFWSQMLLHPCYGQNKLLY